METDYSTYAGEDADIYGACIQRLKIFPANGGPVLRMLRQDSLFKSWFPNGIGEIYFSEILPGKIKAWKMHKRQNGLFAVPTGLIQMVLYDARETSPTCGRLRILKLGIPDDYKLLRIPAGVWYGMGCLSATPALICNCADIIHDPDEAVNISISDPLIPYIWDADKNFNQ